MMQAGQHPPEPFYTLQANYTGIGKKNNQIVPTYNMIGIFTSDGSVNAIFVKPWNNFNFKL